MLSDEWVTMMVQIPVVPSSPMLQWKVTIPSEECREIAAEVGGDEAISFGH